ncbi:hypothetical protein [Micromonospora echinaurantiaca]|uniref:hypothetical protein n=1 Tax=Micromonospora echinaurantiaca TaxID=47857 RepID=UPI00343FF1CA
MFLDSGHPTAVFHPCDGARVSGVSVTEQSTTSGSAASPTLVWSIADASSRAERPITQIRLLETPAGWGLQTTKPGGLLTAFGVDHTYSVWADVTSSAAGDDSSIEFTLGDLRSLSDGQVWAAPKPFAQPQAMAAREEFRRRAAASC